MPNHKVDCADASSMRTAAVTRGTKSFMVCVARTLAVEGYFTSKAFSPEPGVALLHMEIACCLQPAAFS